MTYGPLLINGVRNKEWVIEILRTASYAGGKICELLSLYYGFEFSLTLSSSKGHATSFEGLLSSPEDSLTSPEIYSLTKGLGSQPPKLGTKKEKKLWTFGIIKIIHLSTMVIRAIN